MAEKLSVFIPAAGMGTRLQPITAEYPKPLLLMGNGKKRLIDFPMKLVPSDSNLIISTGFGARLLGNYLDERSGDYSDIRIIEDTNFTYNIGGTLAQHIDQMTKLFSDNVLILPADHVIVGVDIKQLLQNHIETSADITVVAVDQKNYGDYVATESNGKVKILGINIPTESPRRFSSTGIYLFKTNFLMNAVREKVKLGWQGEEYDLTRGLVIPSLASKNVFVHVLGRETYWDDAGTVERYYENNMRLSHRQNVVADSAVVEDNVVLKRAVVLDGSTVLKNSKLNRVIVAPNSTVFYKSPFKDRVVHVLS